MPNYPFSASFFLQCHYRLQNRADHETLSNSDPILATSILFMFFKMYFRESFNEYFLNENGLSGFLEIPLTADDTQSEVPNVVLDKMNEILKNTAKG